MLPHQHFGRLRPHHHTSYPALLFLLLLSGIAVTGMSWTALAAPPAVNPQSGSVGLTGVVRGPAPKTAAVIAVPSGGSRTTTIPVTVSGSCPVDTFVSVTKNNVFAGAAACQDDGTFSLLVDLFDGANTLIAHVTDALGQAGPDSSSVTVSYDAPSRTTGGQGKQLFLDMTTSVVAGSPGQPISRSVNIVGGVAPYALAWDWGDDATSLMSVTEPGEIAGSHTYDKAGTYRVILRVTDHDGNTAFLQFVTVVNGPAAQTGTSKGGLGFLPGQLVAAWPLLGLAFIMVLAFWLGERREVAKLRHRHMLA